MVIDSSGNISLDTQVTNAGDRATSTNTNGVEKFAGISPYRTSNGNSSGLPSGQMVYLAEAAAKGMVLPPFATNPITYSYNLF